MITADTMLPGLLDRLSYICKLKLILTDFYYFFPVSTILGLFESLRMTVLVFIADYKVCLLYGFVS